MTRAKKTDAWRAVRRLTLCFLLAATPLRAQVVNPYGASMTALQGVQSTVNSSTATLGGGGTYTGTWTLVQDYGAVTVSAFADQASAVNGLKVQWSSDGSNVDTEDDQSITASVGSGFTYTSKSRYFRVQYVNGATPQATFRLVSILRPSGPANTTATVTGTVASTQSGSWSVTTQGQTTDSFAQTLPLPLTPAGKSVPVTVTNFPTTQSLKIINTPLFPVPVSIQGLASLTVNAGLNLNTSALALDATVANVQQPTASTTAPTKLDIIGGRTNEPTPAYQPLPLGANGAALQVAVTNAPAVQSVKITNGPLAPTYTRILNPPPTTPDGSALSVLGPDVVGLAAVLANANDQAYVTTRGLGTVGAIIYPGTFDGRIGAECSMDGGINWTGTFFDQANASKLPYMVLQSPTVPIQITLIAMGGCSTYRVRVLQNSVGSVVAQLRATAANDPSVLFASPNNSPNQPPSNAVVAGLGPDGLVHTLPMSNGMLMVSAGPGLPLPRCNAVRQNNCR